MCSGSAWKSFNRSRRIDWIPAPGRLLAPWGCSSAGRALRSQCRGREFDPHQLHHPQERRLEAALLVFAHPFYAVPMIGRLRGELVHKQPGHVIVECGGVGYECAISMGTYSALPEVGHEVTLHVETLLRENDLSLLGFGSPQERMLYRLLVKVD